MGTHPIFESDFDCLTDKNGQYRFVMQEVLICEPVIPNLPLTVECITGYYIQERTYRLYISTREGHLLIYKITRLKGEPVAKLERTIKSKLKIEQLEVFPDNGLLLTIQDGKFVIKDL